jgi:L-asparaginase/Glu-tRNA(Gln) amidotransferase subunit D
MVDRAENTGATMQAGSADALAVSPSKESFMYFNPVVDYQKAHVDTQELVNATVSRVLVIYTGGTIGMKATSDGGTYAPAIGYLSSKTVAWTFRICCRHSLTRWVVFQMFSSPCNGSMILSTRGKNCR